MDQEQKNNRSNNQELEFLWETTDYNPAIFTHVLKFHYSSPTQFDPIKVSTSMVPDESSDEFNSFSGLNRMYQYLNSYVTFYKSSHVLILMGDDFQWENAQLSFYQIDTLI